MIGVSNHLLSIVFGFHYHSQKVIGSLGWIKLIPSMKCFSHMFVKSILLEKNMAATHLGEWQIQSTWSCLFKSSAKNDDWKPWKASSLRMHGTICIFTYMNGWFFMVNVGKPASPMDPIRLEVGRIFSHVWSLWFESMTPRVMEWPPIFPRQFFSATFFLGFGPIGNSP